MLGGAGRHGRALRLLAPLRVREQRGRRQGLEQLRLRDGLPPLPLHRLRHDEQRVEHVRHGGHVGAGNTLR